MPKKVSTPRTQKASDLPNTSKEQSIQIDFPTLQELVAMLEKSQLTELEIDTGTTRVWLSKNQPVLSAGVNSNLIANTVPSNFPSIPTPQTPPEPKPVVTSSNVVEVRSPMVGTFYASPSPDAEPYVKVGDFVKEGQILCIIEAMKLMNEIESEVTGRVVEICVKNAQPVEFNALLFRIEASA